MCFVFLALLEFALVNSYMRKAGKYEKLSKCKEYLTAPILSDTEEFSPLDKNSNRFLQLEFYNSNMGLKIDKLSRFLFPSFFILFNSLYWSYYLWYLEE
uniref:Uncharacterized protein n=1 Tax=Acrobeloides nanus TaxID=290746 RepID=A0A914CM51_9BILA